MVFVLIVLLLGMEQPIDPVGNFLNSTRRLHQRFCGGYGSGDGEGINSTPALELVTLCGDFRFLGFHPIAPGL